MPTYVEKADTSDIFVADSIANGSKLLSPGVAPSTTTITVTVAAGGGAAQNFNFVTPQGQINSDAWESGGSMTVEVRTGTVNLLRARVRVRRVNALGTVLQNGTLTAFQLLTNNTTHTFSPTVPTWTAGQEACGNRLVIQIQFDEAIANNGGSCEFVIGGANSEVVSTITENNGNCRIICVM
jgi:hypothetical protein